MNNFKLLISKAGVTACLFLFITISVNAEEWVFKDKIQRAYDLTLNLQGEEVEALLGTDNTVQAEYIRSLAEALELLITEDTERFNDYETKFRDRTERKLKGSSAEYQFFQAELRLQWAFVYLKFGHELDAAQNLRQAYLIAQECKAKNPTFIPIRKTTGLLQVIVGSVPEKYNWVLSLLGMEGSVEDGLADLDIARKSLTSTAFEADILYALIQGFIFQKPDEALKEILNLRETRPHNRLLLFLGSALAIKNAESEKALDMLNALNQEDKGLPIHYADYLRGEAYLHKADYLNSISSFRWFINNYSGQNYIKDAHYKIALCYWLNGNVNDATSLFKEARTKGKESSEADKHAARSLSEEELPNVKLSKVRYFTDGGYYNEAQKVLEDISPSDIPTKRGQVEFYYRKARLAHKQNQLTPATLFYKQTIDMAGEENWYFAPNACLQLGYIASLENKKSEALSYFNRALGYKKHEYKNSIDSKAKSAIAQLRSK